MGIPQALAERLSDCGDIICRFSVLQVAQQCVLELGTGGFGFEVYGLLGSPLRLSFPAGSVSVIVFVWRNARDHSE